MKATGIALVLLFAAVASAVRVARDAADAQPRLGSELPLASMRTAAPATPSEPEVAPAAVERAEALQARAGFGSAGAREVAVQSDAGIALSEVSIAVAPAARPPLAEQFQRAELDTEGRLAIEGTPRGGAFWLRAAGHRAVRVPKGVDLVRLEPVSRVELRGAAGARAIADVAFVDPAIGSLSFGTVGPDAWACAWDPGNGGGPGGRLHLMLRDGTTLLLALEGRGGVDAVVNLGLLPAVATLPLPLRFVRTDGGPVERVRCWIAPPRKSAAELCPPAAQFAFDGGRIEVRCPELATRAVSAAADIVTVDDLPTGHSYRVEARTEDGAWRGVVDALGHDGSEHTVALGPARAVVGHIDCGAEPLAGLGSYRWRGSRAEFSGRIEISGDGAFRLALDPALERFEPDCAPQRIELAFHRFSALQRTIDFRSGPRVDLGLLQLQPLEPLATLACGHGLEPVDLGITGGPRRHEWLGSFDVIRGADSHGIAIADAEWTVSGALLLYGSGTDALAPEALQPGAVALLDCGTSIPLRGEGGGVFRRIAVHSRRIAVDVRGIPDGATLVLETRWPSQEFTLWENARLGPDASGSTVELELEAPAEDAWLAWTLEGAGDAGGDPLATGIVALAPGLARVAVP